MSMAEFIHYIGRFNDLRGTVTSLPAWARTIVLIAAIPGIVLLSLSILALVVSLLALLLLTVPVYSLLKRLTTPAAQSSETSVRYGFPSSGTKHVDATVVEGTIVEDHP